MAADECRALRGDLAAVALDRAEPEERTRVLAHLDHCADCRLDLEELRSVARALPEASLDHVDTDPHPSADLLDRIAGRARAERRAAGRARVRRVALALAGVAAAVVIGLLSFALVRDDSSTPALQPFAVAPAGAVAGFALEGNGAGTEVVLRQSGLDPDRTYWLWLTDAQGQRFSAGTFAGGTHEETITLQSALPLSKTVRVWCTGENFDEVVLDKWIKR